MNNNSEERLKVEIKDEIKEEELEKYELYYETYTEPTEKSCIPESAGMCY